MSSFNFAWAYLGSAWDPDIFGDRFDDEPLSCVISHDEFGRRVFTLQFPAETDFTGREAAHVSITTPDGIPRHLGYGELKRSIKARSGRIREAQFIGKMLDDTWEQAALLAPMMADPILYIPEIQEASDAIDAGTILAATSLQMEFDKSGQPSLCSIYGDPNKLRIIDGAEIDEEQFDVDDNEPPARGIGVTLTLEWTQRRFVEIDATNKIQGEIDRIATQYYGLFGLFAGNSTMTPGFVDNWPKPGTTVGGSYVVEYAVLRTTDGPGTTPPTEPVRPGIRCAIPKEQTIGIPKDKTDDNGDETVNADLHLTGFSAPLLTMVGVQARKRREVVNIYVPFDGQQMIVGNAEPEYLSFTCSGLDEDAYTSEWQADTYYLAGDVVQANGISWECQREHASISGVLNDRKDLDLWSVNNGEIIWEPLSQDGRNESPLGRTDVEKASTTEFGRRCIQHVIRRAIVEMAKGVRSVETVIRVPVDQAWDLDTTWTVRAVTNLVHGGYIEGKVSKLEFAFDGDSGVSACSITIISAIGNGTPDEGVPEDGEWDGDGDDDNGESRPVATEGGDWDRVNYQVPYYFPPSMDPPESVVKVRCNWLGFEQSWALEHPGIPVVDPYSWQGLHRNKYFPLYELPEDFLEECKTEINVTTIDGDGDDVAPVYVNVAVTYGWKGPRQVILL